MNAVTTMQVPVTEVMADLVASRFQSTHGRPPEAVCWAPGRVNLIGEHTDYNGGLCLPIALPYGTYVAAATRQDRTLTVTSLQRPETFQAPLDRLGPGQVSGWAAYAAGVVWAARHAGIPTAGLDLVVHSTVPLGAGLSSSAALECAVALAVSGFARLDLDDDLRSRLVEICGRAEREVAQAPTGGMDQTISLFGSSGHALLIDCRNGALRQVPWHPHQAGLQLLVIDTRASHALNDGGYGARREQCEQAAARLRVTSMREIADADGTVERLADPLLRRRARHVVSEIGRVRLAVEALERGDWSAVGGLLDASHRSLATDFEVSCPELDMACESARSAGALGARMTGGGFGGSAIALVPRSAASAVQDGVLAAFDQHGCETPRVFRAEASDGARHVTFGGREVAP